ncbi:MAG: hypothetical protein KZQ66_20495 [Candidatus Thiodiazotropha sp. (ex Lucinoma aequizonata)]|nr:hypothetical protein [Candidatus Thiodiazotropha sp. (ex Lucinoma aequizonata)]MCU7904060.1 hypothetical protein [Candidatus Thiodiazotropha sp. (ex Lucinoma aequizonata)]
MSKKRIDWVAEYELGINDIDFQHQYFLDLINRLSDELGRVDNIRAAEKNNYPDIEYLFSARVVKIYPMIKPQKNQM